MSVLSIPNTFTTGTTIQAAPFNQNFTAVQTAVNNIDNTNIGAAGLFPSQLLGTTSGQNTFGSLLGYIHAAPSAGITPLTISGFAGQSVDIFDVTLTSGGTKAIFVPSAGGLAFGATGLPSSAFAAIAGDAGATIGMAFNVPTGSTNGFRWFLNNATGLMQLTAAGGLTVEGLISAGSGTQSGSVAAGDLAASRSVGTGVLRLGGSTTSVGVDFNISNTTSGGGVTFLRADSVFPGIFGGPYTNSSDATLKTNIAPLVHSTASILALKPSSWDWKHDGSPGIGFIAQDVIAVMPELVTTTTTGVMGVNYDGVIPALVNAFQDMTSKLHAAGVAGF